VASLLGGTDNFDRAAKAIGFAIFFDSLDGRVARMTGTTTEFGVQFDSLADVVSFGIAPAVMAYAWGVRSLPADGSVVFQQIGEFGWVCCLAFLICCAWRLARFNVQGMAPGGSKYFVGMPTPAAAGMLAALVHGFKEPLHDWHWSVAWFLLAAGLGALMTSKVRYFQFQGDSLDPQTAVAVDCSALPDARRSVAILGVCAGNPGGQLCGDWRGAAPGALRSPSIDGFADRVIHALI